MTWKRPMCCVIAAILAWGVWRWSGLVLEPLGLSEFLYLGRFCLIVAVLSLAEILFQKSLS